MANVDKCIKCGKCTRNCEFLSKYNLDFSCKEKLYNLAFHCFLCGKCNEVCPMNIDCMEYILELRRKKINENKGNVFEKEYKETIVEKTNYPFKNYDQSNAKVVFFPGCNFPLIYPETTKVIYQLLKDNINAGLAIDCCGKPISDLGLLEEENKIVNEINTNFKQLQVEEIVVACANCYYFFKDKLDVKVTSIFKKLKELNLGKKIEISNMNIFTPCQDRVKQDWLNDLKDFLPEDYKTTNLGQCCGLGASAKIKEPEIYNKLSSQFNNFDEGNIFVYCASCAAVFINAGSPIVKHVLTEILETKENVNKNFTI
ncbi:MAG: (Fe-S)-binding protein [Erysipelotrichaceae bacterium]|nr:(Fe-S)-binding protein [Erysipelotrichaceae bacterium]